ncbi:class I SAM-dependent methyltransferase [Rhizobium sp. TH2]|uniref:class I SAM-dependent methyltransferase n=1 Tax=Rhizobium sp. TH2 TaxID=2775403 RepID=UPI0035BE866C
MNQLEEHSSVSIGPAVVAGGLGVRLLGKLTSGIRYGRLRIVLPSGAVMEKTGPEDGPEATIVMQHWRMLRRVITGGDIGFAEAFMHGDWTTPDLTSVIRFAARNSEALAPAMQGNGLVRLISRIGHTFRANTRKGARKNIEAHYDLGNDFYKQWLDSTMLYSSAIWDETTKSLESAQLLRMKHIREKLELKGGETVLEIGCGWGALAANLAVEADAKVTGITLSPSQLSWARDVVAQTGKSGQVDLRLQDYRDTEGKYDRIVSIEMFEAVGEAYWPSYFQTLKRCLKERGKAVLQIISIEEKRFEDYRRSTDFIQKYVFPGGFLPSDKALSAEIANAGLKLKEIEHFGKSYARTLAEWCNRFKAQWSTIAPLGFDQRFHRLWEYYLCYCEAGFEEGSINVGFYTVEHANG